MALLKTEEVYELSKAIHDGYHGIRNAILSDSSGIMEITRLHSQIMKWTELNPYLKPKRRYLSTMLSGVGKALDANPSHKGMIALSKKTLSIMTSIKTAENKLFEGNVKLVHKVARCYESHAIDTQDLIQEGYIGLLRAIYRFDYTLGNKFSTYAVWWVRQAIVRFIMNKTHLIRLPTYVSETKSKIHKVRYSFLTNEGREPSAKEIADALEVPKKRVFRVQALSADLPLSLHNPIDEDDSPLMDFIDSGTPSPSFEAEKKEISSWVYKLVDSLRKRDAEIIRMRFGLGGYKEQTLQEVSEVFCVSRERIRQIEKGALFNLRMLQGTDFMKPSTAEQLR